MSKLLTAALAAFLAIPFAAAAPIGPGDAERNAGPSDADHNALPVAAGKTGAKADAKPAGPSEPNLKISFKLKADDVEGAGSFVIEGGSQGSYNVGSSNPRRVLTANCMPVAIPTEGLVRAECQFELSGALAADAAKKAKEPVSFQYQGTFIARLGQTLVLVDSPRRHLEVSIEEVPLTK